MVVGMLMKDTLFTVVESDIIEYTIPLLNTTYHNWSLRNTSEVSVSVDCLALSNFATVRVSILVEVGSIFPDTFIFEASIKALTNTL
jgi:hypothetical protein